MSEADAASKLKQENPEFLWKPISDKFGAGTPDRCVLWRGRSEVFWIELKFIQKLPKTNCKVGLKHKQAGWLEEWKANSGRSLLIVAVGESKKVAVFKENFRSIALNGIARENYELINYSDVSRVLKELCCGE